MQCQVCKKSPATVHLTQIIENQVKKVDLCEACAKEKGVNDPTGFSLADLLLGLGASQKMEEANTATGSEVACRHCGFTQADFKKHGRFGCPACYETFRGVVEPMLENMHNGTAHSGKVPTRALERKSLYDRLTKLELDLTDAIKSERYEDAARTRDEINQVKQAFKQPSAR